MPYSSQIIQLVLSFSSSETTERSFPLKHNLTPKGTKKSLICVQKLIVIRKISWNKFQEKRSTPIHTTIFYTFVIFIIFSKISFFIISSDAVLKFCPNGKLWQKFLSDHLSSCLAGLQLDEIKFFSGFSGLQEIVWILLDYHCPEESELELPLAGSKGSSVTVFFKTMITSQLLPVLSEIFTSCGLICCSLPQHLEYLTKESMGVEMNISVSQRKVKTA